jgi:outer membrane protein assembly factor BamB
MNLRAELAAERPPSDGVALHAETGRGPGALSVLVVVPSEDPSAWPRFLAGLHDPRGPADLDDRLGRLAAEAPPGTAFAVSLEDVLWAFPSDRAFLRRRRDGAPELLEDPQVVRLRPGDRVEIAPGPDEPAWGGIAGPVASEAPPVAAPRPRARGRRGLGAPPAVLAVGATAVVVLLAIGGIRLASRSDAPVGDPPGAGDVDSGTGLEERILGLLAGDSRSREPEDAPGEEAPPADAPAETGIRARLDPDESAGLDRETAVERRAPEPTWAFRTRAAITSSPLVLGDRVVFGCRDSTLYALATATGEEIWKLDAGSGVGSSPARAGDLVVVGTYAGQLLAVDASSGELRWRADTGGRVVSSPCLVEGAVVVGSFDRSLHAFEAESGERRWRVATADVVRASPVPDGTGGVVVGSGDGTLWCVDARDGSVRWRRGLGARILAAVAVDDALGRVFAGTAGGAVFALSREDGTVAWRADVGAEVNGQPVRAGDLLLIGTGKGRLSALDAASGEERWRVSADRGFDASPLVLGAKVVAPSYDGILHVLDLADGRALDRRELGSEVFTSPAADGAHVYVGTLAGTFHALPLP